MNDELIDIKGVMALCNINNPVSVFYHRKHTNFPDPVVQGKSGGYKGGNRSMWKKSEVEKWFKYYYLGYFKKDKPENGKRAFDCVMAVKFLRGDYDISDMKKLYDEARKFARINKPKTNIEHIIGDYPYPGV